MIRIKDPISGGSHFIAAIVAIFGLVELLQRTQHRSTLQHQVTVFVFGISLVLLYTASSIHHLIPKPRRQAKLWRRIDHSMIFVFIAGTYTPICLVSIGGALGWNLNMIVWTLAIAGSGLKMSGRQIPRRISSALYICLGWIAVVAIYPLLDKLSLQGFLWLLVGGLLYTFGGFVYALKRPNPVRKLFGFHEIFHCFVIAGSFCHYWTILNFVK